MPIVSDLRPSPIAGLWYSGNPEILRRDIDNFILQAKNPDLKGEVVGLIAPHAGYRYSGRTAGYAYRCVLGLKFDLVVVLSPLHGYHSADILTSAHKAYKTPLGPVWIDHKVLCELDEMLISEGGNGLTAIANDDEHSLEIQLPFIQRALAGDFNLMPVMIRNQSPHIAERLGKALGVVLKNRTALLVASTDLSHFYPETAANRYDAEMLQRIKSFSPENVLRAEKSGEGFACGVAAVATVLWAGGALGATCVEILHQSTSAEETGDFSRVVGYGAAVLLKTP
jgi:AmmeMemoRadiSam system protein B